MVTKLTEQTGRQIEMSLIQFADALSHLEFWNLQKRFYSPMKDYCATEFIMPFHRVTIKPKMTRVYKELLKLEDINEEFEYKLWIAETDDVDAVAHPITFTKDANIITVETY